MNENCAVRRAVLESSNDEELQTYFVMLALASLSKKEARSASDA